MSTPNEIEETREVEGINLPRKDRARPKGPSDKPSFGKHKNATGGEQQSGSGSTQDRKTRWSRFKTRIYQEPIAQWYLKLPRRRRQIAVRSAWIIGSSLLIVAVFLVSNSVFYPMIEERVRPTLAPRPADPLNYFPSPSQPFALVEEREYSESKFKMGLDCIWVARNPMLNWELDIDNVTLVSSDRKLANLDVIMNWDGLVRVYFGTGKIEQGVPLYLRFPIVDGGLRTQRHGGNYRVLTLGGDVPSYYQVGPVYFIP